MVRFVGLFVKWFWNDTQPSGNSHRFRFIAGNYLNSKSSSNGSSSEEEKEAVDPWVSV